jgi:hypothetical protein
MELESKKTMTAARTSRIVLIGWVAASPLSMLGCMMRTFTGVPGYGKWFLFACVAICLIVWILIRNDQRGLYLALDSSGSAICAGAALGFLIDGLLTGKSTFFLVAAKWALLAIVLTWLLFKLLKMPADIVEPPGIFDDLLKKYDQSSVGALAEHMKLLPEAERKEAMQGVQDKLADALNEVDGPMTKSRTYRYPGLIAVGIGLLILGISFLVR